MQKNNPIQRALFSVSNKTGILEFAEALLKRNIALLATGGTAQLLSDVSFPVTEVSNYTKFPEIMDGRLKTLHPKIHGGILGRRGKDDVIMEKHGINPIDIVIINFYPFSEITSKPTCTIDEAFESIDIGGPAMVRAAAKNYKDVVVVTDSRDYNKIICELYENKNYLSMQTRLNLAVKALEYTCAYESSIANYFGKLNYDDNTVSPEIFPRTLNLNFIKKQNMRYGENNHQKAAFYTERTIDEISISSIKQLHGKDLSYNNISDTDTALECVKEFSDPSCVIVKHCNPCGVAVSDSIFTSYVNAYNTDPVSAFGGVIAFNRELDATTAQKIISNQFVEVIIAPSISSDAMKIISTKHSIRVLSSGFWQNNQKKTNVWDFKRVTGGLLVQERDIKTINIDDLCVVTTKQPNKQQLRDALFCWKVAKFVKSNAIVYGIENITIGIGAGQTSRICSAKIASSKANESRLSLHGCSMASDAFFPFRDIIDLAATLGIVCIIQPGGSIRDDEIISAANDHNISMIFTKTRHFRH